MKSPTVLKGLCLVFKACKNIAVQLSGVKKDQKAIMKAWSQMWECCKPAVPCLQSFYSAIKAFCEIEWPLKEALFALQKMAEAIATSKAFLLSESRMGIYSVFSLEDLRNSEEVEKIMEGKQNFEISLQKEAVVPISKIDNMNQFSSKNAKEQHVKFLESDPVERSCGPCELPSAPTRKVQEDATISSKVEDADAIDTTFDQIYSWTRLAMLNLEDSGAEVLSESLQSIESPMCWPYERKLFWARSILRQSFNAVCSRCAQKGDLFSAKMLFSQLQTVGLKPDVNSYNAILKAVVKKSGLVQGFQLVKAMEKDGTKPDINTYNVILKGFCLQLELDKAEALLERMLKSDGDQRPSAYSFNVIFKACVILDDPVRALRVFAKMVEEDIKPNRCTILYLVEVFGRVNFPVRRATHQSNQELVRRLEAIETYMERSDMPHNFRSFNHVLAALSTEGMVEDVLHRLDVAEGCVGDDGLPIVNPITFNIAITTCNRAQQWVVAKDIFRRMKALGFKPDRETYNIFMNSCAEQQKVGDAFRFLREMREERIQPDLITYNTLIKVCCRSHELAAAISLMKDMDEVGLAPCSVTFLLLLRLSVMKGKLNMVEYLVEHMRRKKVQPTISICELVVSAYLTRHRVEDAVEALKVLSTRMVPEDMHSAGQSENILKHVYLEEDGEHAEETSLEILNNAMVKPGPIPEAMLAARLSGLGNAGSGEWNVEESWWAKRLRDQYIPL